MLQKEAVEPATLELINIFTWFDDIDETNWPIMLLKPKLKLKDVKKKILFERNEYLNRLK